MYRTNKSVWREKMQWSHQGCGKSLALISSSTRDLVGSHVRKILMEMWSTLEEWHKRWQQNSFFGASAKVHIFFSKERQAYPGLFSISLLEEILLGKDEGLTAEGLQLRFILGTVQWHLWSSNNQSLGNGTLVSSEVICYCLACLISLNLG